MLHLACWLATNVVVIRRAEKGAIMTILSKRANLTLC